MAFHVEKQKNKEIKYKIEKKKLYVSPRPPYIVAHNCHINNVLTLMAEITNHT